MAWWQLNRELTLTPRSTHYGTDLELDITAMPGWQEASDDIRSRILAAADSFILHAKSEVDQWIGTTTFRFHDLAAVRALILLCQERPDKYDALAEEVWAEWTPAIVAAPRDTGTVKEKNTFGRVLADANTRAPNVLASTVERLITLERSATAGNKDVPHTAAPAPQVIHFLVLRSIEGCWQNDQLKAVVFAQLKSPLNSPEQFSVILEPLLEANYQPAVEYALDKFREEPNSDVGLNAALLLTVHSTLVGWKNVWDVIERDRQFGVALFLKLAGHHFFGKSPFDTLTELQMADLFVWLEHAFPREEDPQHPSGQAHFVGARDFIVSMRDGLLQTLVAAGTEDAVRAIRRLIGELPQLDWLSLQLRQAENVMRRNTWTPLAAKEVLHLTSSPNARLVQTADDLKETLLDAIASYEAHLYGAQKPIRALWDRQPDRTFRPVEEDALSDHVKLFLERSLVASGIIANREVEVGRVAGAPIGQRTDIKIDALRRGPQGEKFDIITAVIEVKGCWNAELSSALDTQLYQRYLVPLGAPVGVYLVGMFDKAGWDGKDPKKRKAPDFTKGELMRALSQQASLLPAAYSVAPFILDLKSP